MRTCYAGHTLYTTAIFHTDRQITDTDTHTHTHAATPVVHPSPPSSHTHWAGSVEPPRSTAAIITTHGGAKTQKNTTLHS